MCAKAQKALVGRGLFSAIVLLLVSTLEKVNHWLELRQLEKAMSTLLLRYPSAELSSWDSQRGPQNIC